MPSVWQLNNELRSLGFGMFLNREVVGVIIRWIRYVTVASVDGPVGSRLHTDYLQYGPMEVSTAIFKLKQLKQHGNTAELIMYVEAEVVIGARPFRYRYEIDRISGRSIMSSQGSVSDVCGFDSESSAPTPP
jgi:hypothetical protein